MTLQRIAASKMHARLSSFSLIYKSLFSVSLALTLQFESKKHGHHRWTTTRDWMLAGCSWCQQRSWGWWICMLQQLSEEISMNVSVTDFRQTVWEWDSTQLNWLIFHTRLHHANAMAPFLLWCQVSTSLSWCQTQSWASSIIICMSPMHKHLHMLLHCQQAMPPVSNMTAPLLMQLPSLVLLCPLQVPLYLLPSQAPHEPQSFLNHRQLLASKQWWKEASSCGKWWDFCFASPGSVSMKAPNDLFFVSVSTIAPEQPVASSVFSKHQVCVHLWSQFNGRELKHEFTSQGGGGELKDLKSTMSVQIKSLELPKFLKMLEKHIEKNETWTKFVDEWWKHAQQCSSDAAFLRVFAWCTWAHAMQCTPCNKRKAHLVTVHAHNKQHPMCDCGVHQSLKIPCEGKLVTSLIFWSGKWLKMQHVPSQGIFKDWQTPQSHVGCHCLLSVRTVTRWAVPFVAWCALHCMCSGVWANTPRNATSLECCCACFHHSSTNLLQVSFFSMCFSSIFRDLCSMTLATPTIWSAHSMSIADFRSFLNSPPPLTCEFVLSLCTVELWPQVNTFLVQSQKCAKHRAGDRLLRCNCGHTHEGQVIWGFHGATTRSQCCQDLQSRSLIICHSWRLLFIVVCWRGVVHDSRNLSFMRHLSLAAVAVALARAQQHNNSSHMSNGAVVLLTGSIACWQQSSKWGLQCSAQDSCKWQCLMLAIVFDISSETCSPGTKGRKGAWHQLAWCNLVWKMVPV